MGSNIYIFTNSYKPVLGGLQTVTAQLAEGLKRQSKEVIVVTSMFKQTMRIYQHIKHVPVYRFPFGYKITLLFLYVLFFIKRPSAVYVHFPLDQAWFVLKLKKHFRFKLITCFHGHDVLRYDEGYSKYDPIHKFQYNLVHASDQVTACSRWLAKRVEKEFSYENVIVVYNCVDLSRFNIRMPSPYSGQYFFAFGRLEQIKGFDLLIQAFAGINNYNNLHLLIAGDGSQRESLERLIEKKGLEGRAVIIGRKTPEEIVAYSQNALANIIPSLREPFGIIALESIAARRPVVATNSGGLPEVMDSRFGVIVEPSVESIRLGLQKVLKGDFIYDGSVIESYLERFTIDEMVNNYSSLLAR